MNATEFLQILRKELMSSLWKFHDERVADVAFQHDNTLARYQSDQALYAVQLY